MLTATRWTKYGKDRLYVNDGPDTLVGWIDLQTGAAVLEREEYAAEFDAIVAEHLRPTADPVAPAPAPSTAIDLSRNLAGESVKAKAAEVRAQAPVMNLVARVLGMHTDERAWRIGAKGEAKVGKKLDKLPDGWHVLHNVPIGEHDSDIDHVVIGPAGMFTLNTKYHPGARVWIGENSFMVNGHKTQYLHNSRFEAARTSKLLTAATGFDVPVEPIIVVVGADITRKADPVGVYVVYREALTRWFANRPARLSSQQVTAILECARWDRTWTS